MRTLWELWDYESENLAQTFENEDTALAWLNDSIHEYGAVATDGFGLVRVNPDGTGGLVAEDAALADLALRVRAGAA